MNEIEKHEVFTTTGIIRSSASKSLSRTITFKAQSFVPPWRSPSVIQLSCTIWGRGGYSNPTTSSLSMQVIYIDLNYLVDKGSIRQEANRQNSTQEEWDKPPSYLKCRFVPSLSQDQVGPKHRPSPESPIVGAEGPAPFWACDPFTLQPLYESKCFI